MTTMKAAWGGYELLDRQSVLVNEDGSGDDLDPELTEALIAQIGAGSPQALRAFLDEVLWDAGIASMDDLGELTISQVIEGIL